MKVNDFSSEIRPHTSFWNREVTRWELQEESAELWHPSDLFNRLWLYNGELVVGNIGFPVGTVLVCMETEL